ncbi:MULTISPECIES: DNA polymerase III subunit chi [Marinobacter]|jgi:DNA polymerase-3 subunit chi|uniref:DNA polymerase III chi subunit, HolC n=1 Tax=Marinobacter nauticus (strain ATCC 700491 / DSM 11845 / VT8) TaxID=351348 RepID=A1TZ87_MARN8|nr:MULTISPECIES: DNA polymerase III subunit chi [Marinobacter]MEC9040427.1 DNA polymerase III subunit chi [Pseudomonadota bacterium]ABM18056.1 DNA polymerase III chi subunit, HolC [Marinobacter nauticus VT8]MAC21213.1 DNA polymerase III subunit chi [Marinobacter sp.]MBU40265.1 DNA polymerase III subunit chi [Marinobacter sp.]MEC9387200.1 DNA polymerase III subunit chi [Pseudomonadota bacterium]|tara:strand:- start:136 stop:645 length:510 start_codon:yes stop_codon:yes gene_type:complete
MQGNQPNPPEPGSPAAGPSGQDDRNQRYWFHILAQNTHAARNLHAAKLVDKAWQQGDRVCVLCDTEEQALELDDLLWNFTPEAFIPHSIAKAATTPCSDPVGILLYPPAAVDWDTVIVLSSALPEDADQYRRLALVAHNDPAVLNQARGHYKQLRSLGIEARVHDMRKR